MILLQNFCGRFWEIDDHGFLVNDADKSRIPLYFLPAIEFVKKSIGDFFDEELTSIYLTGSVSRGIALIGKSDLDILILRDNRAIINQNNIEFINSKLKEWKINRLCLKYATKNQVTERYIFSKPAFTISTQSVLLFGENLNNRICKFKPSIDIANNHIIQIEKRIMLCINDFYKNPSIDNINFWSPLILKEIMRTSFLLTYPLKAYTTQNRRICD